MQNLSIDWSLSHTKASPLTYTFYFHFLNLFFISICLHYIMMTFPVVSWYMYIIHLTFLIQPYCSKFTTSCLISKVNQCWAWLVCGWASSAIMYCFLFLPSTENFCKDQYLSFFHIPQQPKCNTFPGSRASLSKLVSSHPALSPRLPIMTAFELHLWPNIITW